MCIPLIKDDGSIEIIYQGRIVRIDDKQELVWVNDFLIPNIEFYPTKTYNNICRDAVDYFERNMLW